MRVANTDQVVQELLKFNIDIGFIEGVCHSNEIDIIPWRKDELIIIAASNHPLSKKKKISREDFHDARWILREPGSGTRAKFEEAMGGQLTSFFELGHTEAIKQAVQAGLGISCVSRTTVMEALKKGQLVELKASFLKLTRDFYILLHKEKYRTGVLEKFLENCNM
jgi:DNA-binding transcriptional LysR family regulator